MDKFYLHEHRPDGQVSTVGLYYSREEAEGIVAQLRELPEKQGCEYVLVRPGRRFSGPELTYLMVPTPGWRVSRQSVACGFGNRRSGGSADPVCWFVSSR